MRDAAPRSVLVTGASGFVGRHLAPALRRALPEAEIHAAGSAADGAQGLLPIDLTDPASVAEVIRTTRPDVCIHLAGVTHPALAARDEALTWRVNLFGALAVADALQAHAPDSALIHVSTADVYGLAAQDAQGPVDERTPMAPANLYAATKAAADLALGERAARGQRVLRFRPFNHTGPGQPPHLVVSYIGAQIAAAEAGLRPAKIELAAPEVARDFLDVEDACRAYLLAVRRPRAWRSGAVYNIGSGVARTIQSVAEGMARLSPLSFEIAKAGPVRAVDVASACGDAGLARRELGWSPATPWQDTLQRVLEDWRGRIASGERPL
ncbi:NAD-dependent epimerase/dehydratase family protein [Phenylobacterium sp.]|jgi:GDP-4-dehydro-6-deoxy-D-mannose reductase|uniref:NAD-dependent epimerase/dehydratase family protein n=1 Tax=Phenylobacterium sp. TaxID=1871053 RepID=UPI002F945D38